MKNDRMCGRFSKHEEEALIAVGPEDRQHGQNVGRCNESIPIQVKVSTFGDTAISGQDGQDVRCAADAIIVEVTDTELVDVANAVTITVLQAFSVAVEVILRRIIAGAVLVSGRRVVVACRWGRTPGDFEWITHPVAVGIRKAVTVAVISIFRRHATAVVVGGFRVEVARGLVLASFDFKGIAYPIPIDVVDALSQAIVSVRSVQGHRCAACAIVDLGVTVVVAASWDGAAGATRVFARSIVELGLCVIVAGATVHAPSDLIDVTDPIPVRVAGASAGAIQGRIVEDVEGVNAAAVIHSRIGEEVARLRIGASLARDIITIAVIEAGRSVIIARPGIRASRATGIVTRPVIVRGVHGEIAGRHVPASRYLEFVAHTILIDIVEAVPGTIQMGGCRIETRQIQRGRRVVVARRAIHTPCTARVIARSFLQFGDRWIEVACRVVRAPEATVEIAGPVGLRGFGGVIACRQVGAPRDLGLVAGSIPVGVVQAVPLTVEEVQSKQVFRMKTPCIQHGSRIVVARHRIGAAGTGCVLAGPIIDGGPCVQVAGGRIGAAGAR